MTQESDLSTEAMLEQRRKSLVSRLLAKEPELTRELLHTMESLAAIRTLAVGVAPGEYSGYKQVVDAAEVHLRKVGAGLPRLQLVRALEDGGYGPHDQARNKNIRAGIRYALDRSKRLVELGPDIIGLPEWVQ